MNRIDPDFTQCPHCKHKHNNFEHMLWLCPADKGTDFPNMSAWDKALKSQEFNVQLKARTVAGGLRLAAPVWVEPLE
ncbi:hypothetical protein HPB50_022087 [Hyalomma asiaticum]|uniref:Uncharacterized protein n=1 Tax=Hyalomma asiaticum TaxID=266040 RepID=A0ACB7TL70_HYAAI|nr:hypothetical protein HPB50_022087 [Hyalomma asiaticum]